MRITMRSYPRCFGRDHSACPITAGRSSARTGWGSPNRSVDRGGLFDWLLLALHLLQANHAKAEVTELAQETAVGQPQGARRFCWHVGKVAARAVRHSHQLRVSRRKLRGGRAIVATFSHCAHVPNPPALQYGLPQRYVRERPTVSYGFATLYNPPLISAATARGDGPVATPHALPRVPLGS